MVNVRRFYRSIRGRSTLLAMFVLLASLVGGSFLLLNAYENQLIANLDITLEQQVADRVALIESGGDNTALVNVFQDEAFVWIGSPDGEPIAQGGTISPLESPVPQTIGVTSTQTLLVLETAPGEIEREQAVLRIASAQSDTGTVVVAGAELEVVDQTVATLTRLFTIAIPFLVALVGALAWVITGRALRPVANIRSQAESISGTTLTERVPVPDSGDEVEELAQTVNRMLDRIEEHDTAIRRFGSDASHELKSPVANIRALLESHNGDEAGWGSTKDRVLNETSRLAGLVDNLLYLATEADSPRRDGAGVISFDELVFAEAELVSATTTLRVDLTNVEPVSLIGSITDLSRLVRNLVDNAAHHGESRIALSLGLEADEVVFRVDDDGPGVPEADRTRIFERFTRLDEARARDDGGTGLGLSIVAHIVELHKGTITVTDSALGGAQFTVRLRHP